MSSSRPVSRSNHQNWWCNTCDFTIYGHKNRCGKCGTRRPSRRTVKNEAVLGEPRYKSKDWYCHTCDFTIYGHKDRCGKCGSTRLSQEAAAVEAAAQRARWQEQIAKAKADERRTRAAQAKAGEDAKLASSPLDPSKDSKVGEAEVTTLGCIVCWERKKAITFVPCGHFSTCRTCASSILKATVKKCPMCRGMVLSTIETFG